MIIRIGVRMNKLIVVFGVLLIAASVIILSVASNVYDQKEEREDSGFVYPLLMIVSLILTATGSLLILIYSTKKEPKEEE